MSNYVYYILSGRFKLIKKINKTDKMEKEIGFI